MKKYLTLLLVLMCTTATFAQIRIDIADNGPTESDKVTTKTIDGEERSSALVQIQSNVELKYTVTIDLITDIDIDHTIDSDGIHIYTLCFYIDIKNSRRLLTIFAEGFPSEMIDLKLRPNKTLNYMVIAPEEELQIDYTTISTTQIHEAAQRAMDQAQYNYAEHLYLKLTEIEPSDTAFANLANAQLKQAKLSLNKYFLKAIESATKALEINPNNALAALVAGVSYANEASIKSFGSEIDYATKAVDLLEQSIQTYGDDFDYYELTAKITQRLISALTIKKLEKLTPMSKEHTYCYSLASLDQPITRYKTLGLSELDPSLYKYANQLLTYYNKVAQQKPTPMLYLEMGDAYLYIDQFDQAVDCYKKSITPYDNRGESRITKVQNKIIK